MLTHTNSSRTKSFSEFPFEKLDKEQRLKVWIYNRIWEALNYVSGIILKSYDEQPIKKNIENYHKILTSGNIEYEYEAEDFFKKRINLQPDYSTQHLITNITDKVSSLVAKERIRIKANHLNPSILSEKANDIRNNIIDNLSFYEEWFNANMPSINDTLILCQWENKPDYSYLLENLLLISELKKLEAELVYPSQYLKKRVEERKKQDNDKIDQLNQAIKEWVVLCFENKVKENEITTLISNILFLFRENKLPLSIEPITVKVLKPLDVNYFLWHIWNEHKKMLQTSIKQSLIAEYVKKQFPIIYLNIDEVSTVISHLKDGGSYINKDILNK